MTNQPLVGKDLACSFYVQSRHVMLVQGKKPAGSEISLQESGFDRGIPNLELILNYPADTGRPQAQGQCDRENTDDRYYLVCPVFSPGPMRARIRLVHRGGQELVDVRPLICRRLTPAVTGESQAFCFDEAFADALRQLPPFQKTDKDQPLPLVDIVAMGAVYGGFSGFSRLFLRLEARNMPPAPDA